MSHADLFDLHVLRVALISTDLQNPASDSLTIPTSSSPPKYTSVMHDDLGYRVGQGGMAPKGG